MRELVEKEFLAASPSIGLYWLNPSFVWNGDRLAFVKEYRRKGAASSDMIQREKLEAAGQMRIDLTD
jgi:hypothetical protein